MASGFIVLDMKCGEIAAVAVNIDKKGNFVTESFVRERSNGIHKGVVTDVNVAADSISNVISKLKEKTRKSYSKVYATVSSSTVRIVRSGATVLLSKFGKEIEKSDIDKCMRIGSVVKLDTGREALHAIVKDFSVDGTSGIKKPIGLEGVKLAAEINMITIDSSLLRNVEKCVALAGYYLADSVFSGIAYANRTLAEEEALATAALVNLDRDLTEVLIYEGGLLKDCRVVHFGAQFPVERKVSSEEVNNLISVLGSLDGAKNLKGIVVTGDSDMSEKVIEAMEQLLSYPVRYGSCMPKPGEELPLDRMGYVGCLGVLDHIRQQEDLKNMGGSFFTRIYNKVISFADEYF